MNPPETMPQKFSHKKIIIIIGAAVFTAVLAYFAYTALAPRANPCESLFEQTTTSTHQKIESLKKEGADYLEHARMQTLSRQTRQAALGLKTCCILFHEDKISFDEFVTCQNSFNRFETGIDRVNGLVAEIQASKQDGQAELAAYKSDRLLQALQDLEKHYQKLQNHIAHYARRSPELKAELGALSQSSVTIEAEPNDAFKQATAVPMGTVNARLSEQDKKDFFKFDVPSGNILNLEFTPDEAAEPMSVSLRDPERNEIWYLDGVVPGVTKSTAVEMNSSSGGAFFVVVSGGTGDYQMILTLQSQNDAGSGNDAPDQIAKALEIKPNRTYPGRLGGLDEADWYQFEITPGHILNLALTPDSEAEAMNFSLRNFERNEIWNFEKITPGVTKSNRVITNTLSGSKYYLAVHHGSGTYTFEISSETQNDAGSGADAGDRIAGAAVIKPGYSYTGELGGLDEEDWYQFEVLNGAILEFGFLPKPEGRAMSFSLLNSERKEIWQSGEVTPGVTRTGRLLMNSSSGGTYFLKVYQGDGTYQVSLFTKMQNDAGYGTDAGDRKARAIAITSGQRFSAELGGLDEEDWFTFEPQKGEKLSFTCNKESKAMRLALRTLEQGVVGYAAEIFPGMTKAFEIPEDVEPPYFIRIFGGEGRYSIEIN
jgi:hypothetical protein